MIVACAVTAANVPEEEGAVPLFKDIDHQKRLVTELSIDRAYVNSPVVDRVTKSGGTVIAKPWGVRVRAAGLFSKRDFKIDLRTKLIWCPAGESNPSSPERLYSSIQRPAAPARCVASALNPHLGKGAPCPSPQTKPNSDDSANSSRVRRVGHSFASASPSNTRSLTSNHERAIAHATSVLARTCSIFAEPPPSKIWKRSSESSRSLRKP